MIFFFQHFNNPILARMDDAALLQIHGPIAMSTDGYTVDPIEFPGGNIGSLAIHGTVNDVSMLGAKAQFISAAFILEEGLSFDLLERVVIAMASAAKNAGVSIVTGDTKVVPKGAADKIFITTTGIGEVVAKKPFSGHRAKKDDAVLLSGTIGDHGLTVMSSRAGMSFASSVQSDCASLNHMIMSLVENTTDIHVLRDPTRGGLATTLNEIAEQSHVEIRINEECVPIAKDVLGGCSVLGLDPMYLANEGKLICVLPQGEAQKALEIMKSFPEGKNAVQIGSVADASGIEPRVLLETKLGGKRLLGVLEGEQLPRIC